MAVLGTKKFWKPVEGSSNTQRENQILKNTGYINIQLFTVNYMSKGNFWQNTFGGKDNVALTTTIKYQNGVSDIEATSVQDVRRVKVNKNYNFGLQRNIATKIPANSDGLSIEVKMTAVKSDNLQSKFELLNNSEYQSALELAPPVVGQVLTITSLVKRLFTDSDPQAQLEASFAGIISSQNEDYPVRNGKLTRGMLLIIATNEGDTFEDVDMAQFELRGDTLYYKNKQVENTYLTFNISFEALKGKDENSNWFKKYNEAINNLDKIHIAQDNAEIEKIYKDSINTWIEGNALIDADPSYINSERMKIKGLIMKDLKKKYKELTNTDEMINLEEAAEVISGSTATTIDEVRTAFPNIGNLLKDKAHLKLDDVVDRGTFSTSINLDDSSLTDALFEDSDNYLEELSQQNLNFDFNR